MIWQTWRILWLLHVFIAFIPDSSVCTARFVTNDQFTNVWTSFIYEYSSTIGDSEDYCAMRCLMEYYERCHFYWYNGYCYYGNFNTPGQSVLSSDYSGETIKMFQPSLYGEYKLCFIKFTALSISGNNNLMTCRNLEAILRKSWKDCFHILSFLLRTKPQHTLHYKTRKFVHPPHLEQSTRA